MVDHVEPVGTFFGPATLVELLRHRARCQPDDIAFTYLVDGESEQIRLSYQELDQQARAIAAWLESRNLVGERALLLYPAGLEFVAAFFGCLYAGVVAVPVYPPRRNRSMNRIEAIAEDAQARVALTTDSVLQRVEPLIDETPLLKQLTWLATCHVDEGMEANWRHPGIHGKTLAFLQYTSGSTGKPKGVMLNHSNLLHNSALIAHAFEHTRSGSGVFWLPSYHDMGLIGGILQPVYVGRPNVLMSPMTFLQKPFRWLSAISRFRCSTSGGPNFAYELCVEKVSPQQCEQLDLSCWTVAFNGAEPVRPETVDRFCEKFGPYGFRREAFYPCFGLAEATLIVSGGYTGRPPVVRSFEADSVLEGTVKMTTKEVEGSREMVGCGGDLPDQKIVIADPDTHVVCQDMQIGEIWVRGPSIAQGYWRRPEATETTFRARLADTGEGPFLRTGDLGFLQDGELFVTGRVKDLIIVRGVNHYPQDIELTVQCTHERLRRDCGAAFTVEVGGREKLVVVQEVGRHKNLDLATVFADIRRAVAAEHDLMLDAILLLKAGSIPKTSSGKIQRHACRDGYTQGTLTVVEKWLATDADVTPRSRGQSVKPVERELMSARNGKSKSSSGANGHSNGVQSRANGQVHGKEKVNAAANGKPREAAHANGQSSCSATERQSTSASGSKKAELVQREEVMQGVLEVIQEVAKERAKDLTLDTPIVETGLDSLERMEILASLEDRFGGRLPEEIFPDLHTARDLIDAVHEYLGNESKQSRRQSVEEIPTSHYRFGEFPENERLQQTLALADATGLRNPFFSVHDGVMNDTTRVDGRELINFSSYNYIGMSGDLAVQKAAKEAIDYFGTSVSASRLVSGENRLHGELEQALAEFMGTEDAIALLGGHATNETVIGHLLGPGDLILHDALSHNSIVQGAILSGARRRPFPHNDWEAADRLLRQYRGDYRRVMFVIEGAYSMDGDIPDLPQFIEVKRRHKALLMIDEAHSLGTLGSTGRGIGEHFAVDRDDVDIWMGTLSKSLGNTGGFIAGNRDLVQLLRYTVPGFIFSVGLSPPATAGALAALRRLQDEPQRVAKLQENSRLFLTLAKAQGLDTGMSDGTPVVPVILGNSVATLKLSGALADRGVNVKPILHPAVEENAARLRFFLSSLHTEEQIRYTIEVMAEELEKIAPGKMATRKAQAAAR